MGRADGPGEAGDGRASDPPAGTDGAGWLVFLLALVVFVGSALAFGLDLLTGADVARSLAVNAAAAVALVAWVARDTLADPDSDVRTLPGALGTALVLVGGYLLLAALAVAATSVWHARPALAVPLGATGAGALVVGLGAFAAEAVLGETA